MVIWSHWPVFHFSMNPVRIHEGRGYSRQNYFCDTLQCFYEEKRTACNYWHFTLHLHLYFPVFTNTFQTLPDIRSGAVMNFTRPNKILQDRKKPEQVEW